MRQNTRLQGCDGPCEGFFGGLVADAIDMDIDPPPTVDDAVFEMLRIDLNTYPDPTCAQVWDAYGVPPP